MKQVRPKKNLGQHFLTDLAIARRIADTVDEPYGDLPVLEVGPGMGVMTQYLVQKPRPLKVVEIDRESVAYLKHTLFKEGVAQEGVAQEGVAQEGAAAQDAAAAQDGAAAPSAHSAIIEGDFLRMDLSSVFDGSPFVLTGNYPYDISSQIFFKMLDNRNLIPCCTGMIQHEVAERMASQPGTKQYGILSVLVQAWYDVEYLFTVPPTVFNPPPKVQSAVIRMTRNRVEHLGCDEQLFRRVVKTVFNQRRKMLRVSLRQLLSAEALAMLSASLEGQVTPSDSHAEPPVALYLTQRPEQLSIPQFVELTNQVKKVLFAGTSAVCASTTT